MSSALDTLDERLRPFATALFQVAQQINPRVIITSAHRTRREQQRLYDSYRAGRSRFPAAIPGTSKHERGLAFDIGGLTARQMRQLGRIWERWGGRWGGRFKDPIHFESGRE